jgi:phosphate/sulfate permease
VAANIVIAWLLTIPTTAVISGILYGVFNAVGAI